MKTIKVNNNTIDVFMDYHTFPTGFEPSCWLRLYRSKVQPYWKQIAGIKLPSYKYQALITEIQTFIK